MGPASTHHQCRWAGCQHPFEANNPRASLRHIQGHIRSNGRFCKWGDCRDKLSSSTDLEGHLYESHRLPVQHIAIAKPHFCYECSAFFNTTPDWESHCSWHAQNLDQFCGQILRRSVILLPHHCPFCLGDESLGAARRFACYTRRPKYLEHLEAHLNRDVLWPCTCPHPQCA